jgi:protein NRD1
MSVVTDLEAALQAMQNTKPPGVSGSKITFITELSVQNVQVLYFRFASRQPMVTV